MWNKVLTRAFRSAIIKIEINHKGEILMTFMMNAKTVEAIQRSNVAPNFAAKVEAVIRHACSSRKNATRAAACCSDTFTSRIEIDLPKHLANKFVKIAKANRVSEAEFFSGCVRAFAQ